MLKVITTEDGSHSLFDTDLNETYHSTRGAEGESKHVFIKEGLEYLHNREKLSPIRILEVGLGTGLNALLTSNFAEKENCEIAFTSLEPYPISKEIYQSLNYSKSEREEEILIAIHDTNWESNESITPHFTLHKTEKSLEEFSSDQLFDVIYFDAFAPSKQPDVWSLGNLKKCADLLKSGGVLTTYCAQGQFKRNLLEVGLHVETLQGAMGKKEMVRAHKS